MNPLSLFDAYGLRAQLFPALIAGLPVLGLLIVLVPWNHIGLPHAIAALMSGVLMYAFAQLARRYGRKVEIKLGTRSTPELLYRNNAVIDEPLKVRYRDFLSKQLNAPPPSEKEELEDPIRANQYYNSAAAWLRENTRDTKKFKLLFNELVNYGFWRNLLGLKYISLSMNFIILVISAAIITHPRGYLADVADIDAKLWTVIGTALLHSAFMALGVNKAAVYDASKAYGRQLVLCCETFLAAQGKKPAKPRQSKAPSKTA